jgi:3-oxoacyl-[acyl-carrier-protein] synthase II
MRADLRSSRRRVVITGLGVKTPAGNDVKEFWSTLVSGKSAIAPIRGFDSSNLPVRFAGEVSGFDPVPYLGPKVSRQVDRTTQLGFAAAADALGDADAGQPDPSRCAVVAGTGMGSAASFYAQVRELVLNGPDRVNPRAIPMIMPNATAARIAIEMGWSGPNLCITTACAAGAHAIGEGARLIGEGAADMVLAGGAESAINPMVIVGFARLGALSTRNDQPEQASRPFDRRRDGFVLGEGAAFTVLESLERALARRARIYGEVVGYGRNCDAHHITMPSPHGAMAVACMRLALDDAGLDASAIGHINAHGTSTEVNDAIEAEAIRTVFSVRTPPVTSTKGTIGHLNGAAGAAEVVASLVALGHGVVPPIANLEEPGADVAHVDLVAHTPRTGCYGPVLTNSFGFGGHNASLILALVEGSPPVTPSSPTGPARSGGSGDERDW